MSIDLAAFEDALYDLVDESPDCEGLVIDVDDDHMLVALRSADSDVPTTEHPAAWVDASGKISVYPFGLDGKPRLLAHDFDEAAQAVFEWLMKAQRRNDREDQ